MSVDLEYPLNYFTGDMRPSRLAFVLLLGKLAVSQQIYDVWQTTWDRSKLFKNVSPSKSIDFSDSTSASSSVNIRVDEANEAQEIVGFGASLSDSSALTLKKLKESNSDRYWELLHRAFDPTYGANSAGLSYIRVPLGATDFSSSVYSLDDTAGDTSFSHFDINRAPSYVFSTLDDIRSINKYLKVHLVPWSPPGWMKDSGSMNGGSLKSEMVKYYSTYFLKAVQGFKNKGIPIYAVTIQNEPLNDNPSYPTCTMTPSVEAKIGKSLRTQLNDNGFSSVKIIGFELYSFHCYAGSVSDQEQFHKAFPSKDIYFTECSGTIGSDWWSDMKWYMDNLWIGALEHRAKSGLMWNLALDGRGNPKLPGTNSCPDGCRALVSVSGGSYTLNQEFISMAHVSKATIPRDPGGPSAKMIGVSVSGSTKWALRTAAFKTKRASSKDWPMYSLVVLNWHDNDNGDWNPTPVTASIQFRGKQVTYTFPVGITTLWWYAE
ncbi:hypothetical protein V5O48_010842 [Marasmius crinis-equi]|uniref:Glycosyl hydrolase family 30 TIM-barrel domain-containing protein n=1 Tax=Marasmius crinis-equi TaxID=585013 RepID=A0ABR3F7I9_9AGAR